MIFLPSHVIVTLFSQISVRTPSSSLSLLGSGNTPHDCVSGGIGEQETAVQPGSKQPGLSPCKRSCDPVQYEVLISSFLSVEVFTGPPRVALHRPCSNSTGSADRPSPLRTIEAWAELFISIIWRTAGIGPCQTSSGSIVAVFDVVQKQKHFSDRSFSKILHFLPTFLLT